PDLPPDQQPPVSGYVAGQSLTLVRNPNWDPARDQLRAALADRIEIVHVGFDEQYQATLDDEIDLGLNVDLFPEDVDRLRADPDLAPRLQIEPAQASDWIMLNLAVPPFDDLAVRRAVAFATNRQTLISVLRPGSTVQTHALPDLFANGLLSDYDPYGAVDHAGDPSRASAEMARSRYDSNGDGVCDHTSCSEIPMPILEERPELTVAAEAFSSQMAGLGLTFAVTRVPFDDYWHAMTDPASRTPMAFTVGWSSDYLNAASWFTPLARSSSIGADFGLNLSLIGASPEDLFAWGYEVTDVPNLDPKIDECVALTGAAQFACWAELDQVLMERVAAWVPIDTRNLARLTSSLVTVYERDESLGMPSLGRLQVSR
ncbi:MAG: ABC transporter substrate-binding protein, partial [Candidatus Limnocylindrales bacterium]